MTWEQLSYWEGFSDPQPELFKGLWDKMDSILEGSEKDSEYDSGYWLIKSRDKIKGFVVYISDNQYDLDTLFISRLSPAGFLAKKQLLVTRDRETGFSSYDLIELRKIVKHVEFEPWKSVINDSENYDWLEFDIAELPFSSKALKAATLSQLGSKTAGLFYQRWFLDLK
jgi:hypothetical protein